MTPAALTRTIETTTHGRYLVVPAAGGPAPLLVGFHGYAEPADAHLDRLRLIPGVERWTIVCVQGLHRFYERRTNNVVAGWMTRQDRELAIADNIAYVRRVIDAVSKEWGAGGVMVCAGFSQGVAMAFRAAAALAAAGTQGPTVGGVIAVGGDVPPEIESDGLRRINKALVCRGTRDQWYAPATYENDLRRLRAAGVEVQPLEIDAGHEWSPPVVAAASQFLEQWQR
jgi:predicted esterase